VPILVALLIVAYFVLGILVVNKLTAVDPQKVLYDQTVVAISGNSYTVQGGAYNIQGVVGGIRKDGSLIGIFSAPQQLNDASKTSIRTLDNAQPALTVGEHISLQGNIWTTDPKAALGLKYTNVVYKAPLGDTHAWLIPPAGSDKPTSTWTIGVHGINADKTEMLRFINRSRQST
jgi:hypothetical protein